MKSLQSTSASILNVWHSCCSISKAWRPKLELQAFMHQLKFLTTASDRQCSNSPGLAKWAVTTLPSAGQDCGRDGIPAVLLHVHHQRYVSESPGDIYTGGLMTGPDKKLSECSSRCWLPATHWRQVYAEGRSNLLAKGPCRSVCAVLPYWSARILQAVIWVLVCRITCVSLSDHICPACTLLCWCWTSTRVWHVFPIPWLRLEQAPDLCHCCAACWRLMHYNRQSRHEDVQEVLYPKFHVVLEDSRHMQLFLVSSKHSAHLASDCTRRNILLSCMNKNDESLSLWSGSVHPNFRRDAQAVVNRKVSPDANQDYCTGHSCIPIHARCLP